MNESRRPVIVEQGFDVSGEAVWRAITDRAQMIEWFFEEIPAFKAEVGFTTQFDVDTGERIYRHVWRITEVVPEEKIVIDWRYEAIPGVGTVTFEVRGDGDGTVLRVTNEGLETFPQDIPEFTRESCEGGWKYLIQGNLKNYLDS